jgi:hypothetical protein
MPFLGKTPTKLLDANVNIDGGNIDGTTIGASSTAPATVSTFTSTGIDDNAASTAITIDSSQDVTFTSDAKFPDNGKAIFGAGSDLEIYHNGSNSIIKDNGTGNLLIQGATDIVLEDTSGANYFRGVSGSYVRLYHNNSTKLETTATGIEVDGTDGATAIGIRGSSTTNNTLGGLIGFGDSANALVSFIGGGRAESNDDGFLSFRTTIAGVTSEAMHIDRSGNVGIGSPAASGINAPLDVDKAPVFNNVVANFGEFIALSGYQRGVVNINGRVNGTDYDAGLSFVRRNAGNSNWLNSIIAQDDGGNLYFGTGGSASSASTERMRIDSSGNVIVGGTSSQAADAVTLLPDGEVTAAGFYFSNNIGSAMNDTGIRRATTSTMVFDTGSTERMRIDASGTLLVGTDSATQFNTATETGWNVNNAGSSAQAASSATVAYFNRLTTDGTVVSIRQAGVEEGTISVSGSTVSYNGGHLSRWSQSDTDDISSLYKGTVMSNLDEMCQWDNEDNEQLNKTKVSDVEGDVNVAGVFVAKDNSDDLSDYYLAMTGDMIIRIAQGTTVQRGDLLMSAGDGTAKPQDDDIVRSKTIAKVTSTNVTCTYADGSYCVPCVLMAC